jgi:hypothetical protein
LFLNYKNQHAWVSPRNLLPVTDASEGALNGDKKAYQVHQSQGLGFEPHVE